MLEAVVTLQNEMGMDPKPLWWYCTMDNNLLVRLSIKEIVTSDQLHLLKLSLIPARTIHHNSVLSVNAHPFTVRPK